MNSHRPMALVFFEIKVLAAPHGDGGLAQGIKGEQNTIRCWLILHGSPLSDAKAARLLGSIDIGT